MIQISVNTSYPGFKGLDLSKIRVVVGSVGVAPTFYPFITRKADFSTLGDAGTNDRIFDISTPRLNIPRLAHKSSEVRRLS